MCGIAGITGGGGGDAVRRMCAALQHRGPDDAGFWADEMVALGHRRLSIIDLAGGAQPMLSASGKQVLIFNGEIVNYQELRRKLKHRYTFRTDSDTETILAAYEAYGSQCVDHLQGMFAFALWDAAEQRLLLVRDPLGVKPLYWRSIGQGLAFASELGSLLAADAGMPALNHAALDEYFALLYTLPPTTFYEGIYELPAGHMLTWRQGEIKVERYWRPEEAHLAPPEDWIEAVDDMLRLLLREYRQADVPLGALLSGGLDSAAVAAYLRGEGGEAPRTFTIGFGEEGSRYDERPAARALAESLGAEHTELVASADVAALLPEVLRHFGQPFGNPTALLSYALCREVRRHVKTVLSGDGGDECFGGYPRYRGMLLRRRLERIPPVLRRMLAGASNGMPENTTGWHAPRRIKAFLQGLALPAPEAYAHWVGHMAYAERQALYAKELRRELAGHDALARVADLAREAPRLDPVAVAQYVDSRVFLPQNVLQYGDRMSMAHGLEMRVPLADRRLFELLLHAPPELKAGRPPKALLRQCLARRLPEAHLRRPKQGFNPPMGAWLNGPLRPLVEDWLRPESIRDAGYFSPRTVQRMVKEHRTGLRDHTWRLWPLLVFEAWRRGHNA